MPLSAGVLDLFYLSVLRVKLRSTMISPGLSFVLFAHAKLMQVTDESGQQIGAGVTY